MKYGNLTLGQIEAGINKLGGEESFLRLLADKVEVVSKKHFIDCDANTSCHVGWTVESHMQQGKLELTRVGEDLFLGGKKIGFFVSDSQRGGGYVLSVNLSKELQQKPVLNANVLDYLLANPGLIPDSWKVDADGNHRRIFFWGTTYRSGEFLYARCLEWTANGWKAGVQWHCWLTDCHAAVLAS